VGYDSWEKVPIQHHIDKACKELKASPHDLYLQLEKDWSGCCYEGDMPEVFLVFKKQVRGLP
jgi:hypothetical protein